MAQTINVTVEYDESECITIWLVHGSPGMRNKGKHQHLLPEAVHGRAGMGEYVSRR